VHEINEEYSIYPKRSYYCGKVKRKAALNIFNNDDDERLNVLNLLNHSSSVHSSKTPDAVNDYERSYDDASKRGLVIPR